MSEDMDQFPSSCSSATAKITVIAQALGGPFPCACRPSAPSRHLQSPSPHPAKHPPDEPQLPAILVPLRRLLPLRRPPTASRRYLPTSHSQPPANPRPAAKDWTYIDQWLTSHYRPNPVPPFERNPATLKALLALASANETADEEVALKRQVQAKALRELKDRHVCPPSLPYPPPTNPPRTP